MPNWQKAQNWEAEWWGQCLNTYGEEEKQLVYAQKMGLEFFHNGKSPYNIDLGGRSVLDVGGGPSSLLLKCVNGAHRIVVDPLSMPSWVIERYQAAGIEYDNAPFERWGNRPITFDEVWIYNCLQHTNDPAMVIWNALAHADLVRIFEWIDTPSNIGHPHTLTEHNLNEWLGGEGKVEWIDAENCKGKAYYGIFVGSV